MTAPEKPSLVVVYGTVREALILAPVVQALRRQTEAWQVTSAIVGSISALAEPLLRMLDQATDYSLPLPAEKHTTGYRRLTATADALAPFLAEQDPQLVLAAAEGWVPAAVALLAGYQPLSVLHVEAGRPYVNYVPDRRPGDSTSTAGPAVSASAARAVFHRRLLAAGAQTHLVSTETAKNNLQRWGMPTESVFITGSPLVDTVNHLQASLEPEGRASAFALASSVQNMKQPFALAIAENESRPPDELGQFYRALRQAALAQTAVTLAVARPRRPDLRRLALRFLDGVPGIRLLPPLNYEQRWRLLSRAEYGITPGGPLEEEGACFGTPVLVLSAATSWPEAAELGGNRLLGPHPRHWVRPLVQLLVDSQRQAVMAAVPNPYGDGEAADRVVQIIKYRLGLTKKLPPPFSASEEWEE